MTYLVELRNLKFINRPGNGLPDNYQPEAAIIFVNKRKHSSFHSIVDKACEIVGENRYNIVTSCYVHLVKRLENSKIPDGIWSYEYPKFQEK